MSIIESIKRGEKSSESKLDATQPKQEINLDDAPSGRTWDFRHTKNATELDRIQAGAAFQRNEHRRGSNETHSTSDIPSSVATPDPQIPYSGLGTAGFQDVSTPIIYGQGNYFGGAVNQELPHFKIEMPSEMETGCSSTYQPTAMSYELEAQVGNQWAPFTIPGQEPLRTNPSVDFGAIDLNSANSNLMLLQGQMYGAMPAGGSAVVLEDYFEEDIWSRDAQRSQFFSSPA